MMQVRYSEYPGVQMRGVLKKITQKFDKKVDSGPAYHPVIPQARDVITHDWLWPSLGQWLKEDDIVVTETG